MALLKDMVDFCTLLIAADSLDSWGISVTGETPQEPSYEEARRTPPGVLRV